MTLFQSVSEKYFIDDVKYVSFSEAVKILNIKGFGRNKLFKLLRNEGWLDQWNYPTSNPLASLFIRNLENRSLTSLISHQGVEYIRNELL